jgi:hypothetical protein
MVMGVCPGQPRSAKRGDVIDGMQLGCCYCGGMVMVMVMYVGR